MAKWQRKSGVRLSVGIWNVGGIFALWLEKKFIKIRTQEIVEDKQKHCQLFTSFAEIEVVK